MDRFQVIQTYKLNASKYKTSNLELASTSLERLPWHAHAARARSPGTLEFGNARKEDEPPAGQEEHLTSPTYSQGGPAASATVDLLAFAGPRACAPSSVVDHGLGASPWSHSRTAPKTQEIE